MAVHEVDAARRIATNDAARRALQRRTLTTVVITQVMGGAGLAAGVTVGALLAKDMLGGDALAGVPVALITSGSALAAFTIGRITQQWGRRRGLAFGFTAGALGGAGVVLAAALDNVPLLLAAFLVYGSGTATNLQARYAGTDLARPQRRATAVSVAMVSTTLGAVAGPNLVTPLGRLATHLGIPALAGPFVLASVAYLAAGVTLFALLRPDPFLVARLLPDAAAHFPAQPTTGGGGLTRTGRGGRAGVVVGATVMVLTQIAMVAIMTMTPVHMRTHGHDLGQVGVVIGVHIGAMYLPSLVTGVLVDRVGRIPMAVASGVTLLLAGLTAGFAPVDSLPLLVLGLGLLGLGWNFGLISGTALLVDSTTPATRAKVQGNTDVLIALGGAGGGAVSGVLMAASSYQALALVGGVVSLLLIPVLLVARPAWSSSSR